MPDVQPQQVSQDDPRSVTAAALFADTGEFVGNATILSRTLAVAPSAIFLSRLAASKAAATKPGLAKAPAKTGAFPAISLAFLRYQPTPGFYSLPAQVQEIDQELGFAVLSFSGELPLSLSPDLLGGGEIPPPRTECETLYYEDRAQVLMQVSGQVSDRTDSRFRLRLSPNTMTPVIGAPVLKGNQVVGMVTSIPAAAFESNSLSDPFPFVEVLGVRAMAESNATAAVRNLLPWIKGDANPFTGFRSGPSTQSTSDQAIRTPVSVNDPRLAATAVLLTSDGDVFGQATVLSAEIAVTTDEVAQSVNARIAKLGNSPNSAIGLLALTFPQFRGAPGVHPVPARVEAIDSELGLAILRLSGTLPTPIFPGILGTGETPPASTNYEILYSNPDWTAFFQVPAKAEASAGNSLLLRLQQALPEPAGLALLSAPVFAGDRFIGIVVKGSSQPPAQDLSNFDSVQVLSVEGMARSSVTSAIRNLLPWLGTENIPFDEEINANRPEQNPPVSEELPEHLRPAEPLPPPFGGEMQFPGYSGPPMAANPTPKVASDLWAENDQLGYEAYARTIASLITHSETMAPLTIGIKAPWGAGKTSLMKRVQHLLDGYAKLSEESRAAILQEWQPPQVTLRELLQELKGSSKPTKLESKRSKEGEAYGLPARITVWFNAWKYQTSEQIWAGMAHCIISQVTARMDVKERELFWLRLHGRRVNVDEVRKKVYEVVLRKLLPMGLLVLAVCVIAFWMAAVLPVGLPWRYAIRAIPVIWGGFSLAREWGAKLSEKAAGTVRELIREPDYEGKMGYLHLVESDIREVLQLATEASMTKQKPNGDPLVVFVDDLDRCAPNKVAEVVEAINLFLCGDYPNCIFVLGMEPGMVAAALEVANKEVIEKALEMGLADSTVPVGWRFMEKIVQLPITIPPPAKGGRESYVKSLTGVYEANVGSVKMFPEVPGEQKIPASVGNLAGALGMTGGVSIGKVLRDVVRERELALEPLNETEVLKYVGEMEGKTLGEVEEKSAKILAEVTQEKRRAAAEASKRVYARTFSERDPAMMEFVNEVAELVDWNPRQIKRYVNVFRFYSTLRHSLRVDGSLKEEEIPSDKVLAKFVALSIQWPHAVDCLRAKKDAKAGETNGRRTTVLELLELQSRKTVSEGETVDGAWEKYVGKDGLGLGAWAVRRAFREFLSRGESLCDKEGHGLW